MPSGNWRLCHDRFEAVRVNPFDAVGVLWGLLKTLKSFRLEVAERDGSVLGDIS
jgi:hypothetical protein